uniref:Rap-GAP domain-containing protein n=1 Tax=Echinostoma caproni TaxID=27848 RepID=A0A183ASK9_9TREM
LSDLAKERRRIQCLLMYVAEKCLLDSDLRAMGLRMPSYLSPLQCRSEGAPIFDTTLRFTLSALWNLTDECPEACLGFVEEGGLRIYERVLKRFADQEEEVKNHVYTKCLGLLNNVAEVDQTRETLLVDSLMDFFFKMLRHPSIHISYFAAGIIAHLSCLQDEIWMTTLHSTKDSYIKLLGQSVCSWQPPQSEMVAYRSFEPFEQLVMHPQSRLEVHLWAVWAIHHILTRKEVRYVPALCDCRRLLDFLRYVVSVDETVLCANSVPRLSCHSRPDNSTDEPMITDEKTGTSSFPGHHSSSAESPIWQDAIDTASCLDPPSAGTHLNPGCAGDSLSGAVVESDYIPRRLSSASVSGNSATGPGALDHVEPVGQTAAGLSASAGPDSCQLECARLIRTLAAEIVHAVDRYLLTSAGA